MKKIVLIIALIFGFTITASAQKENKTKYSDAIEEKIAQSIQGIVYFADIHDQLNEDLRSIFGYKFTILAKETVSEADKIKAIKEAEAKLRVVLHPETIKQLNEKGGFDQIVNLR
jgi:hypothetical protein